MRPNKMPKGPSQQITFQFSPPWHIIRTQFLTYHLEVFVAYIYIYMCSFWGVDVTQKAKFGTHEVSKVQCKALEVRTGFPQQQWRGMLIPPTWKGIEPQVVAWIGYLTGKCHMMPGKVVSCCMLAKMTRGSIAKRACHLQQHFQIFDLG